MIAIQTYPHLKAIHVKKDNHLLFEYIREGESSTRLYPVGCIFKSFLSVLTGIAIEEKKIYSVSDSVIDYLPHDDIENTEWYSLHISHALSKTTGIKWPGPFEELPDTSEAIMKLPFEAKPGLEFKYKPDPQIVILLLEAVYHLPIQTILQNKLLTYFSNSTFDWYAHEDSISVSVDLLDEFGQLMLRKGVIGEKRFFSEAYYKNIITKYSDGGRPEFDSYGLGWWLSEYEDVSYFYAAGFGGQLLVIIPSLGITISMISDMDRPHPENKEIIHSIIDHERGY